MLRRAARLGTNALRAVILRMSGRLVESAWAFVETELAVLAGLDDAQLRDQCRRASEETAGGEQRAEGFMARLVRVVLRRNLLDERLLQALALGIEAFRRAPADLRARTVEPVRLFPEQEEAAIALLHGLLVQMDTGEGKTYAILPAAFALACRHGSCVIATPTDYLAWRDVQRTAAYWEFVGLPVDIVTDSTQAAAEPWAATITYTTMNQLMFSCLNADLSARPHRSPSRGALILDEADTCLLDNSDQYMSVRQVGSATFDWERATAVASALDEDDFTVDPIGLWPSVRLTDAGHRKARAAFGAGVDLAGVELLIYEAAVEFIVCATRVVEEGVHYFVRSGQVVPIDQTDGRPAASSTPGWAAALARIRGLRVRPARVCLHRRSAVSTLGEFRHVGGLSGTLAMEATELLLVYRLLVHLVPPRRPRHDGMRPTLVFSTRDSLLARVCEVAADASTRQPVLIVTRSISEATRIAADLRARGVRGTELVTGERLDRLPTAIENAGSPGSVVVTTQIVARGVDIVLTDEAVRAGGLALMILDRYLDGRLERQILGRVGRQGQPYSARFLVSREHPIFSSVPGFVFELVDGESVPGLDFNVELAQQRRKAVRFRERAGELQRVVTVGNVTRELQPWFAAMKGPPDEGTGAIEQAMPALVSKAATQYAEQLAALLGTEGPERLRPALSEVVTAPVADRLLAEVAGLSPARIGPTLARELESAVAAAGAESAATLQLGRAMVEPDGRCVRQRPHLPRPGDLDPMQLYAIAAEVSGSAPILATPAVEAHRAFLEAFVASVTALEEAATALGPRVPRSYTDTIRRIAGHRRDRANALAAAAQAYVAGRSGPPRPADPPPGDAPAAIAAPAGAGEELAARPEPTDALVSGDLDQARTEFAAALAAIVDLPYYGEPWTGRTPFLAADWAIKNHLVRFWSDWDLIEHRFYAATLARSIPWRRFAQQLDAAWKQAHADLGKVVVQALVENAQPYTQNGLFVLAETRTEWVPPERTLLPWTPSGGATPATTPQADLVSAFVTSVIDELPADGLDAEDIRGICSRFLTEHPLHELASDQGVARAVRDWREARRQDGVKPRELRRRLRWISRFLSWLHDRRSIPALPTRRTRLALSWRDVRMVRTDSLAMFGLAALAVVLAAGVAMAGMPGVPPHDLAAATRAADAIFAFGAFGEGSLLGVALLAVVAARAVADVVAPQQPDPEAMAIRLVAPLAAVVIVLFTPSGAGIASRTALALLALVATGIVGVLAGTGYSFTQLPLQSIVVVASALAVGAPTLAAPVSVAQVLFGTALLVCVLGIGALWVITLPVTSVRGVERVSGTVVQSAYRIPVRPGWLGYGLALAAGLRVHAYGAAAVAVVFVLVIWAWTLVWTGRVCAPDAWQYRLRKRRQLLIDRDGRPLHDVTAALGSVRRSAFVGQAVIVLVATVLAFAMFPDEVNPDLDIPVALVVLAVAGVVVAEGHRAVAGLYALMRESSTTIATLGLDFDSAEDKRSFVQRWSRRPAAVVGGFLLLTNVVADYKDRVELLVDLVHWLRENLPIP